ncbi:MAG: hypothetical protein HYZ50_12285 [Deltaproteobacteria bacterium]|nr:hypothetical protein [Deltaproteobacteria bacterium]
MARRFWLLLFAVLAAGCVSTTATRLGTSGLRASLLPESVAIYRTAAQVPGKYEEVALLYSKGAATMTNEPQMFDSMKAKAAELGANGIILDAISEPSAGAKIAGAFLGYAPERQGNAIAIYIFPPSEILPTAIDKGLITPAEGEKKQQSVLEQP